MLQDTTPFTPEQVNAVADKLQAFFETLDADERLILQTILLDWCGSPNAARLLLWDRRCLPPDDTGVKRPNPAM
jgi:hypothetical protein